MTVKIDGTNTVANPAFTGADTDTGLQCGTNEVKLVTGGTARATVDSSGNLGVGIASPSSKTHIKGGSLTVEHGSPSTGTCQFNINCENNSQVSFSFDDQGHISFGSAATPHNQGSFSEKLRIQNGGGISFNGDTGQVNALDDYEEGTWIPQILGTGTNGTWSAANANGGFYVKIGKQVTAWFNANGTLSGASGIARVHGLPFTTAPNGSPTAAKNAIYSTGSIQYWNGAGAQVMGPLTEPNTNLMYFHTYATNSSSGGQVSVVNTTHNLHAFVTYFTA